MILTVLPHRNKIMFCMCKHEGQDSLHGKQKRVFNEMKKAGPKEDQKYRCTICGAEKTK